MIMKKVSKKTEEKAMMTMTTENFNKRSAIWLGGAGKITIDWGDGSPIEETRSHG